jgi:hypothetical protein
MKTLLFLLLLLDTSWLYCTSAVSFSSKPTRFALDPYVSLTDHLLQKGSRRRRHKEPLSLEYGKGDIYTGLKALAASHAGIKSIDKLTEKFKSSSRSR